MASQTQPKLGWIGLGSMGLSMASNLQKHLTSTNAPPLHFTNRTLSRGVPLVDLGGIPYPTIAEVVEKSDLVILSLSDDAVLQAVTKEILATSPLTNKIIVDTTTVHPDTTKSISTSITSAGGLFVAAPVFGASPVAAAGRLLFILAGPKAGTSAIKPFLEGVMGRSVIELGEEASKASLMKTTGNFITAGLMELYSEAHVFAEVTGLGSPALESLIEQNYGELALNMSKRLTTGAYLPKKGEKPWSDLNLAIKDVGHGVSVAEAAGTRLKIAEVAVGHLREAREWAGQNGGRELDSSCMYGVIRREAGLDFESEVVKERDA